MQMGFAQCAPLPLPSLGIKTLQSYLDSANFENHSWKQITSADSPDPVVFPMSDSKPLIEEKVD